MNETTFTYQCPSCGGKVTYFEENHKWKCDYCNNSYDSLFVPKEVRDLPSLDDKEYLLYAYDCPNCNKRSLSINKDIKICPRCNSPIDVTPKEVKVSNVLKLDLAKVVAQRNYEKEVTPFAKKLSPEYLNNELDLEYINCDLYNGCIKLIYNNIKYKYIFVNLLVPNLSYPDYRFMYEVGNIGINDSREYSNEEQEKLLPKIIEAGEYFTNIEDLNFENEIVTECMNDFCYKNSIFDPQNVQIEKELRINDGVYFPIYTKTVNGERQYVLGNFNTTTNVVLQFPETPSSRSKTKTYEKLSAFFSTGAGLLAMATVYSLFSGMVNFMLILLFIIGAISFFILYRIFNKKYEYFIKTIKISKEDYFKQIITNCNYVKVIKVKK